MTLKLVTTEDDAELKLLSLANEKRKFAIAYNYNLSASMQVAFERGIDDEWFTLVDVTDGMAYAPGHLMRVFQLTDKGAAHLERLKSRE